MISCLIKDSMIITFFLRKIKFKIWRGGYDWTQSGRSILSWICREYWSNRLVLLFHKSKVNHKYFQIWYISNLSKLQIAKFHACPNISRDSDLFYDRNATKYKTNDKKNKKRSPYQGDAVIKRASQHAPVLHLCTSHQKMSKQINLSFFLRECRKLWRFLMFNIILKILQTVKGQWPKGPQR